MNVNTIENTIKPITSPDILEETNNELLDFKKEIAKIYVEKLKESMKDNFFGIGNLIIGKGEKLEDLLVAESFGEKITEGLRLGFRGSIINFFAGKKLKIADKEYGSVSKYLQEAREKINAAKTKAELDVLYSEIDTDEKTSATEKDETSNSDHVDIDKDTYAKMLTAQDLGSKVVEKGIFVVKKGRIGLCGAAVRGILSTYLGVSGIPSSGASGEKWDNIMEGGDFNLLGKNLNFKKVEVDTPYDAKPGAIIPYENGSILGSNARKIHGHVEVLGKDGRFYYDTVSLTAGGSAKITKENAKKMTTREYQKKTGFEGYVYYPVIKGELT